MMRDQLMQDQLIRYFAPAHYREGTELDTLVEAIIDKTAAYERLKTKYVADHLEGETK